MAAKKAVQKAATKGVKKYAVAEVFAPLAPRDQYMCADVFLLP